MNDIAVILPALNEEKAIGSVIGEILVQPFTCDIVVADNGSTDRTAEIAQSLGARVIPVPARGKGNAVRTAIQSVDHEYVFMLDSDGTYPACYLVAMLDKLEAGYEAVIGERQAKKEAMKLYNRACNLALNTLNGFLYGGIRDICSGMWGFQGPVLKKLDLSAPDFTLEADIFTSVYGKYKLARVPVEYRERLGGTSKIKFKDGLKIAQVLAKRCLK